MKLSEYKKALHGHSVKVLGGGNNSMVFDGFHITLENGRWVISDDGGVYSCSYINSGAAYMYENRRRA